MRGKIAIAGTALAILAAGCGAAPAQPRNTVADCEVAFIAQIAYAEAHPGSGASMSMPRACRGLTAAQVQQAAAAAVLKTVP